MKKVLDNADDVIHGTLPEIESRCNHFFKCSALNAALNTVPALHTALIVTWIWYTNFLNRTGANRNRTVTGCQCSPPSNVLTEMDEKLFTGGPGTNDEPALGLGLQSPFISSIG
jgi:hypothetical protein